MRKFIAVLATILLAFSAVGCSTKDKNDGGNESVGATPTNPVVTLNGFESNMDLNTISANGVLGKIQINKDTNFLTEGKQSAKVTVTSKPWQTRTPSLFQATEIKYKEENYTDFGKVKHVLFDIYNAENTEKKIGVQLAYTLGGDVSRFWVSAGSVAKFYTLQPNAWTTVRFDVPREYIPTAKDADGNTINKVIGINLEFERPKDADENFYIDNFRLYRSQTSFNAIEMTLQTDEICSFDSLWQMETLTSFGDIAPSLNLVGNITSTGQGTALRMDLPSGEKAGSCGFYLGSSVISQVDWDSYDDNDELCFDVYVPETGGCGNFSIRMTGNGTWIVDDYYYSLPRGEWITFRYSVARINGGLHAQGDRVFRNMNNFGIYTSLRPSEEIATIYVDNIRMERK